MTEETDSFSALSFRLSSTEVEPIADEFCHCRMREKWLFRCERLGERVECRCRLKARLTLGPRLAPDLGAEGLAQVAMGGGGALVLAGISACSNFTPLRLSSAYFLPAWGLTRSFHDAEGKNARISFSFVTS
jgi:hypothetical protein